MGVFVKRGESAGEKVMCDAIVGLKSMRPERMRGIIKNYIYPSDEKLYYFLAREN